MGKTIGVSDHWFSRLKQWSEAGLGSKKRLVEESLSSSAPKFDREMDAWLEFKEKQKNDIQ